MSSTYEYLLQSQNFAQKLSNKFCTFLENEQFTDMTLAADGHLVKVHKVVLSMASEYFKEMVLSPPCPHPVIHISGIKFDILKKILEYVYTGEVTLNFSRINEFVTAAESLRIPDITALLKTDNRLKTLKRLLPLNPTVVKPSEIIMEPKRKKTRSFDEIVQNSVSTTKIGSTNIDDDKTKHKHAKIKTETDNIPSETETGISERTNTGEITIVKHEIDESNQKEIEIVTNDEENILEESGGISEERIKDSNEILGFCYARSNKGEPMLVVNKFLYYPVCVNKRKPSEKRWRCVDYKTCPASLITENGIVTKRFSLHRHPSHEKKIAVKLFKGQLFKDEAFTESISSLS